MATNRTEQTAGQPEYQSPAGCLPRLFWMGLGNIALVLAALLVYKSAGWSIADGAFWLTVGLLICARYVDIVRYQGMTADGEPATTVHFRRYVLMLIVVSAAVWTAARLLGPGFAGAT